MTFFTKKFVGFFVVVVVVEIITCKQRYKVSEVRKISAIYASTFPEQFLEWGFFERFASCLKNC